MSSSGQSKTSRGGKEDQNDDRISDPTQEVINEKLFREMNDMRQSMDEGMGWGWCGSILVFTEVGMDERSLQKWRNMVKVNYDHVSMGMLGLEEKKSWSEVRNSILVDEY